MTPYEVVYGQKPPPLLPYQPFDSHIDVIDRSLQEREAILRSLKAHLEKAQHIMKVQADKSRIDRSYQVSDWVFIKLQPYRKLSLKNHSYHKLSAKFFGPFKIIAKVGHVAYTLALPPHSKIHPTFHVSLLKKILGAHTASVTLAVIHSDSWHVLLEPEEILDRRLAKKNGKSIAQILVKWMNIAPEGRTWEDLQYFKLKFRFFNP
ncbi:uncharacterized protein LOC142169045 [Nicotiana tabacum]|uniref:Uncharacterized protein LOC142169045 n=1 Tax=Nicotiana tabacum TaxID=4097 RepID=A0AC58SN11_TOBAC